MVRLKRENLEDFVRAERNTHKERGVTMRELRAAIADKFGYDERTVEKYVFWLHELGLIDKTAELVIKPGEIE